MGLFVSIPFDERSATRGLLWHKTILFLVE
jgi:hypothetical protein